MTQEQVIARLKYPRKHLDGALSHAHAYYVDEYYMAYGDAPDIEPKDIDDLCGMAILLGLRIKEWHLREFYEAMLKVVPHIAYPMHCGTECRGWYRVWGTIKYNTRYFAEFDMVRDNKMPRPIMRTGPSPRTNTSSILETKPRD